MHLFSCMAKQQTNPIGKKQMPHNIPQQVKSFVICPVWQLGQFPCCITATLGAFNSFWVVMAGGLLIALEKRLVIFVFENLFQMSITILLIFLIFDTIWYFRLPDRILSKKRKYLVLKVLCINQIKALLDIPISMVYCVLNKWKHTEKDLNNLIGIYTSHVERCNTNGIIRKVQYDTYGHEKWLVRLT